MGSLFLDGRQFDEVADLVEPDDLYLLEHREVFRAIGEAVQAGEAVDPVLIGERLEKSEKLALVGGYEYLHQLVESMPHAAHAKVLAEIVREKSLLRRTEQACTDAIRECRDPGAEVDAVVGKAEQSLHSILEREGKSAVVGMSELLSDAMAQIGAHQAFGVPSGFSELDKITNGFQPGDLTVIGARPSVGKTALGIRIGLNAARDGFPFLMFSLEQNCLGITERILSMETHIAVEDMRKKNPADDICDRIAMNSAAIESYPLWIDDTPSRTVATISAVARLMHRKRGLKLILVDYLQLIAPADRRTPREQQVGEATWGLKILARTLKVPVIVLAQLNREIEKRSDKRPLLSDLRESGAIEQHADVVLMLDRPETYDETADKGVANLYIRKQRQGRTGEVRLSFHGPTMTFKDGVAMAHHPEAAFEEQRHRNDRDEEEYWR